MALTLVILAAGKGTRFGRLKQLEPVGPDGSALMDYAAYDALRAGAGRVVLVVPPGEEARFEAHARQQLGSEAPVSTISQRLDDLPDRYTVPTDRTKPWGTGHALLAAAPLAEGPVMVANADDWYGFAAYRLLVSHLERSHPTTMHGLVGYRVDHTLSPHGGVSRAVCTLDAEGNLTSVEEVRETRRTTDGRIAGKGESGQVVTFSGDELVSTGLWGFDVSLFAAVREAFARFLEASVDDPDAEFLIGTGVAYHVASGMGRLHVLPTDEEWFGMTFADDAPLVREKIAALVEQGEYPVRLRG